MRTGSQHPQERGPSFSLRSGHGLPTAAPHLWVPEASCRVPALQCGEGEAGKGAPSRPPPPQLQFSPA